MILGACVVYFFHNYMLQFVFRFSQLLCCLFTINMSSIVRFSALSHAFVQKRPKIWVRSHFPALPFGKTPDLHRRSTYDQSYSLWHELIFVKIVLIIFDVLSIIISLHLTSVFAGIFVCSWRSYLSCFFFVYLLVSFLCPELDLESKVWFSKHLWCLLNRDRV